MSTETVSPAVLDQVARVCHEANRAYCASIGDDSQVPWSVAPEWQRSSAVSGIEAVLKGMGPKDLHESWYIRKRMEGWVWGPNKDPEGKKHPCLLPYEDLPPDQRVKDRLFRAVARALLGLDGA